MKTPGPFGLLTLGFAVAFFVSVPAWAADPAPEAKEEKVLPPIPIPIVPTRFLNPDDIPDPPEPAKVKPKTAKEEPKPEQMKVVVSPATLNRLYHEADVAFSAKDYNKAADRLQQLIDMLQSTSLEAKESIYFNFGLANLLAGKAPEAEAAFKDCIKQYPSGEYTSRAYLGLGKSRLLQNTATKKAEAIEAFNLAAKDPILKDEAARLIKEASDKK